MIKKIDPQKVLQATHFSTTSGKEDKPEIHALVTWELHDKGDATVVAVSQDGIQTEKGVEGRYANWNSASLRDSRRLSRKLRTEPSPP